MDRDQSSAEGSEQSSSFSCSVCREKEVEDPVVSACGHLFCWSCLLQWLDASNSTCPVCTANLERSEVTPLYVGDTLARKCSSPKLPNRPRSRTLSPRGSKPVRSAVPLKREQAGTGHPDAPFPSLVGLQLHLLLQKSSDYGSVVENAFLRAYVRLS